MLDATPRHAALKLPQVIALYIGAVLGSGILIIPGVAAEVSGPASLLAWGLMTVLVLPMALTMGLLAANHPHEGGVSYFVTKAFNPRIGSLVGWYLLAAVVVGAPVIALTGAGYLCASLGLSEGYRITAAVVILVTGLVANYYGMRITGQLQVAVVLTILAVLVSSLVGSIPKIDASSFTPFMPHGPLSVGYTLTVLFWCFVGWEAVANIAQEFQDPRRDAIRGTIIAAVVTSIIYFLSALCVVGTHSYGHMITDASLVHIIKSTFGASGAVIAGGAAFFICLAPAIAYIGAVARLVNSLAESGYAPRALARVSKERKTPTGGLCFLAVSFAGVLLVFSTGAVPLSILIQVPSAAFILTYLGASAAGTRLLRDHRLGLLMSWVSLALSAIIFLFAKWTIAYTAVITAVWYCYAVKKGKAGNPFVVREDQ